MNARPPWYGKLTRILAPTDQAARVGLIVVILICLGLLVWGDAPMRALALVYIVSP